MRHRNNDIDDSVYRSGTVSVPYLALPERLNPKPEPEDSPSLFFRLMFVRLSPDISVFRF